jgi:hypothetical protein
VATFRALAQLDAGWGGVESVATDTVEDGLAPLEFKPAMIPPIIEEPKAEKHDADQHAINHDGGGKVGHRGRNLD